MIKRQFSCNLCGEEKPYDALIGLHHTYHGWEQKSALNTENHLCALCLSSLQAFEPRCGQGFKCTGGPDCGSDHK